MRDILYSSPYVPAEWIAAYGLTPRRLVPRYRPTPGSPGIGEGMCPVMWHVVREAASARAAAGVVLATTCDQMRRAADLLRRECPRRRVHVFHVPAISESADSRDRFAAELARLAVFLIDCGGQRPRPATLRRVLAAYDARRRRERETAHGATASPGRRIALVGGPLFLEDRALLDTIAENGGRVALDATETGERMLPAPFDRRQLARDPVRELARAYEGTIPDAFRRPNRRLYGWLARELRVRRIEGLIVCRHLWCDLWHAEVRRIRDRFRLPILDLDFADEPLGGRNRTRIQAFLESLNRTGPIGGPEPGGISPRST